MKQASGSLGGQNTVGRHRGARSSRARSTIFKKLRKLDSQISVMDRWIRTAWGKRLISLQKERSELDAKRKEIRQKRKAVHI